MLYIIYREVSCFEVHAHIELSTLATEVDDASERYNMEARKKGGHERCIPEHV